MTSCNSDCNHIPCVVVLENHPADSRVKISENGNVQALTSRMGTGGGNVPLLMEDKNYYDAELEVETRKYPVDTEKLKAVLKEHKGNLTNKEIAECLNKPITLVEHWFRQDNCFAIPDADVWQKLKDLLHIETTEFDESITTFETKGGNYDLRNRIYTGDNSPTLMQGCGNDLHLVKENGCLWDGSNVAPTLTTCNAGGNQRMPDKSSFNCVIQPTEPSYGIDRAAFNQGQNAKYKPAIEEVQPTMVSKGSGAVGTAKDTCYIVRRLTPTECARLQGFPDWWCSNLGTENPTKEDIAFWKEVFTTYGELNNIKPKSENQIIKYLKDPYADASEYKMWGNGIALPCATFVLSGIVWAEREKNK